MSQLKLNVYSATESSCITSNESDPSDVLNESDLSVLSDDESKHSVETPKAEMARAGSGGSLASFLDDSDVSDESERQAGRNNGSKSTGTSNINNGGDGDTDSEVARSDSINFAQMVGNPLLADPMAATPPVTRVCPSAVEPAADRGTESGHLPSGSPMVLKDPAHEFDPDEPDEEETSARIKSIANHEPREELDQTPSVRVESWWHRDRRLCKGGKILDLVILAMALILQGALLGFHCTPLLSAMTDESDAMAWAGVTDATAVVAGLLLGPSMFFLCWKITTIVVCWKTDLAQARSTKHHTQRVRSVLQSKSATMTAVNYLRFTMSPASSYFFAVRFLLCVPNPILQVLALESLTHSGAEQGILATYATVIWLRWGLLPLAADWISRRFNRLNDSSGTGHVPRRFANKLMARLEITETACSLFFAGVFFVILLIGFHQNATSDRKRAKTFTETARSHGSMAHTLELFSMLPLAENAFWGGDHWYDIFLKFCTRALPLLSVPFGVIEAIAYRNGLPVGVDQTGAAAAAAAAASASPPTTTTTPPTATTTTSSALGSPRDGKRCSYCSASLIRQRLVESTRRTAFKGRYHAVPRWAIAIQSVVLTALCIFVYIRLATWGTCRVPQWKRACDKRAFPIFKFYNNDIDNGCRSCICYSVHYARHPSDFGNGDGNCSTLTQDQKRLRSTRQTDTSQGCTANPEMKDGSYRFASEIMDLSPVLLEHISIAVIMACPSDTMLLETLSKNLRTPAVLHIHIEVEALKHNGSNGSDMVPWTFPDNFAVDQPRPWPLVYFGIYGQMRRNTRQIELRNLPGVLGRMTHLRSLALGSAGLTKVPGDIGSLSYLRTVIIPGNKKISSLPLFFYKFEQLNKIDLTSCGFSSVPPIIGEMKVLSKLTLDSNEEIDDVPDFLGKLTSLKAFKLSSARVSSVSTFLGQLTKLTTLTLANNKLRSFPPSFGRLTALKRVLLSDNLISIFPPFLETLTDLETLYLSNNRIASVPTAAFGQLGKLRKLGLGGNGLSSFPWSSFEKWTNLDELWLQNNSLTMIPALDTVPGKADMRLTLESNRISLAVKTEALSSLENEQTDGIDGKWKLLLLGRNPACLEGSQLEERGLWEIRCQPECDINCKERVPKGRDDKDIHDYACSRECDTRNCKWDRGDCEVADSNAAEFL